MRHGEHLALQQAVAREVEGIDLDRGLLPRLDEADVAVGDHRLDLELAVGGTITISACAGVTTPPTVCTASCCTTPSTGAVSFCRLVRCSALITSWARPAAFCSALARSSSRPCGDTRRRSCCARLLQGRDGRIAFAQPALLDQELLLLADQVLQLLEIDQLGAELLARTDTCGCRPAPAAAGCVALSLAIAADGGALGLLLRDLAVERGELGALLRHLAREQPRCISISAGGASAGG